MSYYGKNDWRFRSNGLSKSSSQPNYLIPHELNKYNSNYLPLIRHHQQAQIFSNQINKSNRIKNEILNSKYKLFKERGIDNYNRNKYKDSWSDFFKKKEREKERKKIYKIIQDKPFDSSEEEENANDIFRNGLNSMPTKIEEKIKLKQYLPAKKDLVKLMRKVNDNVNERVDKNSYLLSKNIRNLENGYDDLKEMIENKINRMERKQEEDFYDLRNYFKRRAKRENNKFSNNLLLENGQNILNGYDDNNNDYYKPNMKENIEKLQTYEIAKRIQNIPNLLDNMIENIENIREYRKEQKNDFLLNFNNNFKNKYNDDPLYDELDEEIGGNNLRYNNYDNYYNNYNLDDYDSEYDFDHSYMSRMTPKFPNAFMPFKPRTEFKRNARKDILSMSKTEIDKLRKNLKPLTYQQPKKKLDDNEDLLTGRELMEIYKERNSMPKINFNNKKISNKSNKINIQENKMINKLRESEIVKNNNTINNKKDTQEKKDDSDDIVVIGSDNEKSDKETSNKNQKEETKKDETQKQSNKEEEKKEESSNSDDDNEDSNDDSKDDNNENNNNNNNNNNVNNNSNNNANNNSNNNINNNNNANNNANNNINNNNIDNNKNDNENDEDNKDDDDDNEDDGENNEDDDEDN